MKAIALPLALLGLAAAGLARSQEPAGAHLPGVSRDCEVRMADLQGRQSELGRAQASLAAELERLAGASRELEMERGRAESGGADAVERYNARMLEHNRRVAMLNDRVAAANRDGARFNAEGAALAAECTRALRIAGSTEVPPLADDERAVLAAALGARLGANASVVLENHTATFLCSRSLPDLVQFEGCSGMRGPGETPQQVIAKLKRAWPTAGEAIDDLAAKADQRARIDTPIDVPARQVLRGYGEGGAAEGDAVKVSRVGFDVARQKAVAFVAVRSRDRTRGFVEYVWLERASGSAWRVAGRLPVR